MRSQDTTNEGDGATPHEWGRITVEQRYHRIAKDVSLALRYASLNKYEGLIVEHLIEESWTRPYVGRSPGEDPSPLPVAISPTDFAERYAVLRTRTSESLAALVARRLTLKVDAGYLLNKRADEWLDAKGAPLLTPAEVERCVRAVARPRQKSVPTRGRKVSPDGDGARPHSGTEELAARPQVGTKSATKCPHLGTASVPTWGRAESSPQTPIGEARASEDLRRVNTDGEGLDAGARKSRQLDSQPEYTEDATFDRIRDIVEQAAPNHAGTLPWRLWLASGYRPRLIEKAVKMALVSSDGKRPWPYALQILEGWKVNGDPDDREPLPRLATHTAPAPRPKSEQELKRERVKAALAVEAARVNALYAAEEVARG